MITIGVSLKYDYRLLDFMRNYIKVGILFVIWALAQRFLDRFFDWSESILFRSIQPPILSLSDWFLIIFTVIGGILILVGLSSTKIPVKKESDVSVDRPRLDHELEVAPALGVKKIVEIAECANCGNRFYPSAMDRMQSVVSGHATCPKCGKTATINIEEI